MIASNIALSEDHSFLKTYGLNNQVQYTAAATLFAQCISSHFSTMLDLGCGDGRLLKEKAAQFSERQFVGIDISEELINAAKQHEGPNLQFNCLDVRQLQTCNKEYNLITSFFCLQWLSPSEIQTVFHQILSCLTSQGELLLLLPLDQATLCNARSNALKNYFPNHSIPFGIKDSTVYDSLFDLNKTPFTNSIVKLKTVQSFPFPNSLFKTYIEGWISEFRDLPFDEKRKERYLNDIIEAMPKTTNGMVEFATKAYCLHIQKN